MSKLPDSWERIPLGEVIQTQKGKKPKDLGPKSDVRTVPYINIKAFEKGTIDEYAPEQDATECLPEDILLVWDGARSGLSGRGMTGYVGSTLARVRSDLANADYLYYFVGSCYSSLNTQTKGVGIPHVNPTVLNQFEFPLPPANEQVRIVNKLEELFTDLDSGVAELKAAQIKLGQYRQSLLKSAVDGSLTEAWRKENAGKISETGEQLLQRILKERRERWEQQQFVEFESKGNKPPKDWQRKYPEPVQPDTSDLPDLPDGWTWASIDQLAYFITSGSRGWAKYYSDAGSIFIRAQNIKTDELKLDDIAYVSLPRGSEGTRTLVNAGDILLTITGANVGKCALVRNPLPEAYVSQHVALIRLVASELSSFVHMCLINPVSGRAQLNQQAYGAGKPGLNLKQVGEVAVPIPSQAEAIEIMTLLADEQKRCEEKSYAIANSIKQSEMQRMNFLKSAFAGELVAQDPNDKPASILLDRIREERALRAKLPKPKKSKGPQTMKSKGNEIVDVVSVLKTSKQALETSELFKRSGRASNPEVEAVEAFLLEIRDALAAGSISRERKDESDFFVWVKQ